MKANVIQLTPTTREFLKKLHFPEIPEEANYVAFLEDGNATFFEELKTEGWGVMLPKFAMLSYYEFEDLRLD